MGTVTCAATLPGPLPHPQSRFQLRKLALLRRGQAFGADRFEVELVRLRPVAKCAQAQERLVAVLNGYCPQANA